MASKYVRETKAGKALNVYVITRGARHVATVQAHFSDNPAGSVCLVNVWQPRAAQIACMWKAEPKTKGQPGEPVASAAHERFNFQYGRAGGYGYDKFAAALSGLWIDGHCMTDHCGARLKPKIPRTPAEGETQSAFQDRVALASDGFFPRDFKAPKGYRVANYNRERNAYSDCYREQGFDYLRALGYEVNQVL